ncbi:Prion-like-(Q/N-rich) domain-bearing protein 25, partial [Trichinella pseudospiralis]
LYILLGNYLQTWKLLEIYNLETSIHLHLHLYLYLYLYVNLYLFAMFNKLIFYISLLYLAVLIILGDDSSLQTTRNKQPTQSLFKITSVSAKLTSQKQQPQRHTDDTSSSVVPKLFVGSTTGVVPPGGICSDDEDCSGYPFAFCMGNCMCKDFAINAGSTCLEPGSMNKGNCGIGQVYVSEAGICMNVASPGSPCQYSQQCSGAEVGAFCISMRCRCVYGMTETSDGKCTFINSNCTHRGMIWIAELGECKPVIAPGARSCTHRQQCTASYRDSHCFMTQCSCPPERPIAVDGTCGISCSLGQTYSGVLNRCVPTAQPGDRCQYSSQCHALFPGTVCDRSICRCPNDFYWTGTHCTDSCPDGYQPNPKTGVCKPGCREGQIDYEGECLNQMSPDHPCIISAQCTGGSSCTDGRCQCPPGKSSIQGVCTRAKSRPGGSCEHGEECTDGSYCLKNRCVCPKGFVLHNQRCTTPLLVPPESACGPDVACGGGSFCVNNICTCPNGHIVINQQCQLPDAVPPGSRCTETDHCSGGSFCLYGICRCPTGMVTVNQRCQIPIEVMPGQTCRVGIDICIGRSYCVEGTCRCPEGMAVERGVCRSPSIVLPGFKCDSMTHCGGGSVCVDGVCTCPKGMTVINQRCEMAKTAPPNYSCRNQEICTGGSSCVAGVCICPRGQIPVGDICKGSTDQSKQRCVTDDQCAKGFSCVSSRCVCAGMLLPNGVCKTSRLASLGSKCVAGLDVCTGGSSCIGGTCTCPSGTIAIDGRCRIRKRVLPGDPCDEATFCGHDSKCIDGRCVCLDGFEIVNRQCRKTDKKKSALPGERCDRNTVCTGGALCEQGKCTCRAGFEAHGGICKWKPVQPSTVAYPGQRCVEGVTKCLNDSTCLLGTCTCPPGFVLHDKYCKLTAAPLLDWVSPGFSCDANSICTGGSTCIGGICQCPTGESVEGYRCVTRISVAISSPPGSYCRPDIGVCTGGSYCRNNVCVCPQEKIPIANQCVRPKEQSMKTQQCGKELPCRTGMICVDGMCRCKPGSTFDPATATCIFSSTQNSDYPRSSQPVMPGESCKNGEICSGGSACNDDRCVCPEGSELRNYVCSKLADRFAGPCPAENRLTSKCQLPYCFCSRSGFAIPNRIPAFDTPQMVILTFDDPINEVTFDLYRQLFDGRFRNPNGCPIKATFFVSHEYNNYHQTQWMYWKGHEIAVNSITHETLSDSSVDDWIAEMAGLRNLLQQLAAVNVSTVQGIRAPQLSVGGNAQFTMMQSQGFLYDNSMSVNPGKDGPAYWPQTLDYRLSWHCEAAVCPDESFPGIWAVPINQFYGNYINDINQYMRGAMVRAVMTRNSTAEAVLRLLLDNFNRHYRTNRAPFVLTLNADFLRVLPGDGGYKALERFLAKLSTRPDVWVITMDKLIAWMRMPTPLSQIKQFAPWQCDDSTRQQARPCQAPRVCSFETAEPDIGNRWISTCAACPLEYPWTKRGDHHSMNFSTLHPWDKQIYICCCCDEWNSRSTFFDPSHGPVGSKKLAVKIVLTSMKILICLLLRLWIAVQFVRGVSNLYNDEKIASNVPQNKVHYYQSGDPCNIITDQHLMISPNIQTAYLQCVPSSHGLNGRWQTMPCPPGQTFQFGKQRCDFDFAQTAIRADDSGVAALPSVLSSAVVFLVPLQVNKLSFFAAFVGQPCHGKYCFGGSECHSEKGICTCPKGTVVSANSQFCHSEAAAVHLENDEIFTRAKNFALQASPGSSCEQGEVCSGGSKCDPARFVCTCDDGTVDHDGRCVNIVSDDPPASSKSIEKFVGDRCESTNILQSCPPGASCVSGICACISPMIQDGNHCRPLRASVHRQKASQQCQGGSVCSSVTLRCACPLGTKETDDHCVDISSHKNILASVGEHCEANTDCIHGAYCHTGSGKPHCECLSTHVEIDRSCLRVIYPGQHGCSSDKQCSAVYNGAWCRRGICACPEGTGAGSQTCSKQVHTFTEQTLPEATTTALPSVSEPSVYSASSPGGTCTDSAQCLGGSTCYMNICVCPEQNMHAVNGVCIYKTPSVVQSFVTAGSRCNESQICAGGSICRNGICTCGHGTVQQGSKCIKTFMPGIQLPTLLKYCISDSMCKGNSICINKRCACLNGMRFMNGQCVPEGNHVFSALQNAYPAFVSCSHDTDCKNGSVCVQGRCVCPPGTQMTTDGLCESYQLGKISICLNFLKNKAQIILKFEVLAIKMKAVAGKQFVSAAVAVVLLVQCSMEIFVHHLMLLLSDVNPVNEEFMEYNASALSCSNGSFCFTSDVCLL